MQVNNNSLQGMQQTVKMFTPEEAKAFANTPLGKQLQEAFSNGDLAQLQNRGVEGSAATSEPKADAPNQKIATQAFPPANEASPGVGLDRYQYQSTPPEQAQLLSAPDEKEAKKAYIKGYVPTPEEAGKLKEAGVANVFNPEWQAQVDEAVTRNGGLGNAEDGYLAWGKMGFIRLKNDNLSPEQNRKMAEISLQTGYHVEDTPARSEESVTKENVNEWVNTFISRHDSEMAAFVADPKDGYSVQDGSKRHFKMEFNEEAGRVVSFNYKKSGGVKGWVQKNMKYIGPVLDVVSVVGHVIPGIGTAVALGAQALKTAASWVATGSLKVSQAISAVAGFIPGVGQVASRVAGSVAGMIENGKVTAAGIYDVIASFVGTSIPNGIKQVGAYAANAIDKGKVTAEDLIAAGIGYFNSSNGQTKAPEVVAARRKA